MLAGATSTATLVLLAWLLFVPAPVPRVVAVLNLQGGAPGWVALEQGGELHLAVAGAAAPDPAHDYELWAIAGGPPRPIGVLPRGHGLIIPAGSLSPGVVLAVSLEPRGGSPTGLPTGPVLSQGRLLGS